MSSVEFHEDEWGRHWSYAPALHGTQVRLHYSLAASVIHGITGLVEAVSAHFDRLRGEREAAVNERRLRDIHGEDEVLPIFHARYLGVRDEFGRPLP
ncbi:hypothetical protein [Labrys neptuniae]